MCELYTLMDGCRQKPSDAARMIRGSGSFVSSPRKPLRPGASGTGEQATSGYQITNNANPRHQTNNNHHTNHVHQRFSYGGGGGGGANVRRSFNPSFHQPQQPQSPPRLANHPPAPPPTANNPYYYQQQQPQHHHHQHQRGAQYNFRSSPDYHQQMEKHRAGGISSWLPGACKENLERLLDMNWPEISAAASS